jgi:hypothetical protein
VSTAVQWCPGAGRTAQLGWAGQGWAGLGWAGPCALQRLSELWQVAATLPAEVAAILREFDVDGDGMLDP